MKQILNRVRRFQLSPTFLNEAVNFDKQCIFIAVPKTGTTSVRTQLTQQGVPLIRNPHLNILQVRDSLYVYFLKNALGGNNSFPTHGIIKDSELRKKAELIFSTFFKFSAVRNPWSRAISLYSRREGIRTKDKSTFEEFCENHFYASDTCLHPTLHKNQLDWLCDENGKCIMDYVYKVEEFGSAIKEIESRTDGRIKLLEKEVNKNPNSPSKDYKNYYSDKTRKIIEKRFQKDIDYFKYTF